MLPPPPGSTLFPYTTLFRSRLHCRVGSSEIAGNEALESAKLHCRVGSSEKRQIGSGLRRGLHCRVGSSEIFRCDEGPDRKSTRLNSSHVRISYAVFCLKKKN